MRVFCQLKYFQNLGPSRMLSIARKQESLDYTSEIKVQSTSVSGQGKVHYGKVPVILCKNEKLNHYQGQSYNKFNVIPLACKGWDHRKSKGDYFEINNFGDVRSINEDFKDTFQSLGILEPVIEVLENVGIKQPTNIQADGIKHILNGCNTLLAAETGSGKTLAYLLPLVMQIYQYRNDISREKLNSPFGLVVTPSRELAVQIGENAKLFSESLGINVEVITGGHTKKMIMSPTFKEVDLVISSIGALSKLITTGICRTTFVQHIVLDEADTLLDDSFNSKLLHILRRFSFLSKSTAGTLTTKPCVQISMASATVPTSMKELLADILPVECMQRVTTKNLHCIQPHVPQKFIRLGRSQKPAMLLNIARSCMKRNDPVLIFSNKSATCDWISLFLNESGIKCVNLNGDMHYRLRIGKFEEFQNGDVNILSCTDMGSRGLDTIRVKHLLNYDFPIYMADYIHRCGRTGRIGSPKNCCITHFITGELEIELVKKIELAVRKGEPLPNVNANIRRIIEHKYNKLDSI